MYAMTKPKKHHTASQQVRKHKQALRTHTHTETHVSTQTLTHTHTHTNTNCAQLPHAALSLGKLLASIFE